MVEDANSSKDFQKGDIVVASDRVSPVGGMAEYMAVAVSEAVKKPKKSVGVNDAAASSSAVTARNAVMNHVEQGDRVLILGRSGGVGSAAIQMAKQHAGASFVATTSSQEDFCKSLGADQVINYNKKDNWWEMKWEQKFDKIIDTVGGSNFYGKAEKVLRTSKKGGAFVAVCGDDPVPDCRTVWKAVKFFAQMSWRPLYTWLSRGGGRYPKYVMIMPYDYPEGREAVLEWMENGTLKMPLDESSPLPFTADGVRQAFQTVASGHAHGKVVVSMEKK
jgi:NADPH:quinone reductase-like Zn-dependent oxidoreductase